MSRVVSFYEKLPRGPAPAVKPKGLLGRYQARYFGKNPSAARTFMLSNLPETHKIRSWLCFVISSYRPCSGIPLSHRLRPELLFPFAWV